MDLLRCVVLVILFRTTTGDGFIISDNLLTWTDASKQCELAEPDLIFSSKGVTVTSPVDTDVWVGYYQTRTAFEYFGCAQLEDDNNPSFKTMEDPGQCMSACGAQQIIGTSKKQCFCFGRNEPEPTYHTKCKDDCNDQNGIVCGGSHGGTDYMSLYRSIGTDILPLNITGKCLYYDYSGFHWQSCTKSYKIICEKGSDVWIQTDTQKNNDKLYNNWAKATVECFKNSSRPSSYSKTESINAVTSTPQLWTGIVSSQVIYKYTNGTSYLKSASKYGYIERVNDVFELKFANVEDKKKSLCVNGTISTSSSTGTPPSTTASTPQNNSLSTSSNIEPIPSADPQKHEGSSDVGAVVGAILSIVIAVVIVIVVILFLRKRGTQLPFLKKEKQSPTPATVHNNSYVISRPVEILQSTYQSDQDEYAEIDLTTTKENEARNGATNNATDSSDYAHDYIELEKVEEETYDSTQHNDKKSDQNTFNPYNKLSLDKGSNYDHIGIGARNTDRKVSDSENTYNTTSLGTSYLKTSTDEPNNAYNMAEDPEDTYNHTNIPMHQTGLRNSENDYDAI